MSKNAVLVSSLLVIAAVGSYFALRTPPPPPPPPPAAASKIAGGPVSAPLKPTEPQRPAFAPPKQVAAAPAPVPAEPLRKDLPTRALRRKAKGFDAAQAGAVQGLAAAPVIPKPEASTAAYRPENAQAAAAAKISRREKNMSDPMQGRWVKDLSGGGARVGMGKKSIRTGNCSQTRACERKPAPEQAWVAGVVVTTERLEASPTAPLQGQLIKGHYLDDTPGVYVE